jgi:hypothetical protein
MIGYVQLPPISFKEENWTFFSSTQNLAAVLNDPNEGKRSKEFFTRTWGAEFEPCEVPPLTLLQAVPKHYFSDYIRKIKFVSIAVTAEFATALYLPVSMFEFDSLGGMKCFHNRLVRTSFTFSEFPFLRENFLSINLVLLRPTFCWALSRFLGQTYWTTVRTNVKNCTYALKGMQDMFYANK